MHLPLRLAATLSLSLLQVARAIPGQVPVVDGVVGGVRDPSAVDKIQDSQAKVATAVSKKAGEVRVTESSGICETTPDVYTASGYVDIADDKSVWFWYFAARENPETAPLSLWFNGGPGSSSMIGLLRAIGPCRITNDSSMVELNPWSWNNNSNVLFIDQPVGAGFSYGTMEVGTTPEAASDVWDFMQIFLANERFSDLADKPLAIWTESYGGHYGPTFAAHFLDQNDAIASGSIEGITLNLQVLGIGDGSTDPLIQYPEYIEYAKYNPFHQLVNDSVIEQANKTWSSPDGCKARITACYDTGVNDICSDAQGYCNTYILGPLAGEWDLYYVPSPNPDPYPANFTDWLISVSDSIGAESEYHFSSFEVYDNFALTGDWMHNSRPDLEKVVDAGVRTVIYAGEADYICNYMGIEAMMDELETQFSDEYLSKDYSSYTVNGEEAGLFKTAGTLSYIRVFGAGHEVPAYGYGNLQIGEAAFQIFSQTMSNQSLTAT